MTTEQAERFAEYEARCKADNEYRERCYPRPWYELTLRELWQRWFGKAAK